MKLRPPLLPYVLLALFWVAFAAYVWVSSGNLPERVATHFGSSGEANGWETHAGYVRFTLIFGAAIPLFVFGIFSLVRVGDGALMNIPRKDYWLAPERRRETFAFVQRQGIRMARLLIAFFALIHHLVLMANARMPANLPLANALWAGGALIAGVVMLMVSFIRYFYQQPA
jgi:serine/threonine-protein kinase